MGGEYGMAGALGYGDVPAQLSDWIVLQTITSPFVDVDCGFSSEHVRDGTCLLALAFLATSDDSAVELFSTDAATRYAASRDRFAGLGVRLPAPDGALGHADEYDLECIYGRLLLFFTRNV